MRHSFDNFKKQHVLAALAAFALAGAAQAADTSVATASSAVAPHTLTVEVCHPDPSGICTRDRAALTSGGTFDIARTTNVPYVQLVASRVDNGSARSKQYLDNFESGFKIHLDAKRVDPTSATVEYVIQGKGVAAWRDVKTELATVTYPSTESNQFTGTVELRPGESTPITLGLETVKLTLDAK